MKKTPTSPKPRPRSASLRSPPCGNESLEASVRHLGIFGRACKSKASPPRTPPLYPPLCGGNANTTVHYVHAKAFHCASRHKSASPPIRPDPEPTRSAIHFGKCSKCVEASLGASIHTHTTTSLCFALLGPASMRIWGASVKHLGTFGRACKRKP